MQVALVLVLVLCTCSTVVHVGVSQSLPTVLPRTETVPPPIQTCSQDDQIAFFSSLPNAAVCGSSVGTVFAPPANDTVTLANALKNVCTDDCGGIYADYLKSTCKDELGAETLRIYCTPTNGSAAVGSYCYYATRDPVFRLFDRLSSCNESEFCSPSCRRALMNVEDEVGCCYQNVFNNTVYSQQLLSGGFITPSELAGLQKLNNPVSNPWNVCGIKPPQKCGPPLIRPPPPPRCMLEDQIAFISSFSNAAVCGLSLATVFVPPPDDSIALSRALTNVCTDDCAGVYSNFLKSVCNDQLGAESLAIYCTPTNRSAAVGNYCRYAAGDILNSSIFSGLFLCDSESSCSPACREALLRLKRQVGCCYQNVYNNTAYNRELLRAGFITSTEFTGLQQLNFPNYNLWVLCEIEPPKKCGAPLFKPPAPPKCTLNDQIAFISSLPNVAVCGPSIGTVLTPGPPASNDSTALTRALMNVCTNDCGGVYSNYLSTTCNDQLAAENLRILCVPTHGAAVAGPYCRFASDIDISYFDDFPCINSSSRGSSCSPRCRAALLRIKAEVGCCYQELYNNTLYGREQLLAGFLTPIIFTEFQLLNNPVTNPWIVCDVTPPRHCPAQPRPDSKCTQYILK